ncbi:short-chain dehydrogenase [Parafrankia colletiae]|uniref:Short-chain dehydrogenase n=2 Tax=Parafrankia colletiae TaxID=573497 RepID=A0A1S1R4B3_9ACTN|nr:short-chain dehydrogenase [Parafrankia colletiae]
MGLATAEVLVADGARVALVGRDTDRAQAAVERLGQGRATALVGDVGRPGEAERLLAEAVEALGELAGVAVTTGTSTAAHASLDAASDQVWADAVDDVLMGTVRTVRAAVPHLVAGGGGTVVTTAAYGMRAYHPDRLPYVTLKSGVAAFTKTVARAYGGSGVRANCVCPGAIETASLAALRGTLARERGVPPAGLLEQIMVEEWHMDVALRRPGTPGEVGDLFAFLLSPRAGYLTGAVINIDGGTQF